MHGRWLFSNLVTYEIVDWQMETYLCKPGTGNSHDMNPEAVAIKKAIDGTL